MRLKRRKRRWIPRHVRSVALAALCFSVITGCSLIGVMKPKETSSEEAAIKTVKVEKIMKQRIEEPVEVTGDVMSSMQVDIIAQMGGDVLQVMKTLGDTVQEGDILAELQSEDAETARDQAAAKVNNLKEAIQAARLDAANGKRELEVQVKKMELEFQEASRQLNKTRNDHDSGLVTTSELNQAEIQLEAFRIDLELAKKKLASSNASNMISALNTELNSAQATLKKAEEALVHLQVTSPISGFITSFSAIEGGSVIAGGIIGRIEKMNPIRIVAQLNEEAAGLVRGRKELTYSLPNADSKEKTAVSYLANVMDLRTKTYELRLDVPNKDVQLRPGMQVLVQLTDDAEQIALSIPQHSMISEGKKNYVFVLKDGTVEKRLVVIGRSNDFYVEVLSGVQEGELLVVTGQSHLQDKEKVLSENVQG